MIEIMEEMQRLVPSAHSPSNSSQSATFLSSLIPISFYIFGGDQLTCERARNSQRHRKDSATTQKRLEGLISATEDWHTKMNYYEVSGYSLTFTFATAV